MPPIGDSYAQTHSWLLNPRFAHLASARPKLQLSNLQISLHIFKVWHQRVGVNESVIHPSHFCWHWQRRLLLFMNPRVVGHSRSKLLRIYHRLLLTSSVYTMCHVSSQLFLWCILSNCSISVVSNAGLIQLTSLFYSNNECSFGTRPLSKNLLFE